MSRLRNPFKLRASEKIETDGNFLRLYSPIVLDSLLDKAEKSSLWDNVLYIHSSPGAGKSSLLRVFEPTTLTTLFNRKSDNDYKGIFSILKKLEVVNDNKIRVLGVSLICTRNYEILEELDVSEGIKKRYFLALLNARIVLGTLRAAVNLISSNLPFYEALEAIHFSYDNQDNFFSDLSVPCNGLELYKWASDIEKKIYDAIDSFLPLSEINPHGDNEIFALSILKGSSILYEGKPIVEKILFMLDDSHKLSLNQRTALKKYVLEKRGNFSIWISERLEALEHNDNLRSFEGRDYEELNLERFWSGKTEKFGKILVNIADKRAAMSSDDVNSFKEFLEDNIEEEFFKNDFIKIIENSKKAIDKLTASTPKYQDWLQYMVSFDGSLLEKMLLYKQVEILIYRNIGKPQLALDFALTVQELLDKLNSTLNSTAQLFISNSSKIPYYFGFEDLIKLSSNNIEQFLSFSADLFENMLSNRLSGNRINISSRDQQRILMEVADKKWEELNKVLPDANIVISFLKKVAELCRVETYKPNAPYAPGVTGFAIKQSKKQSSNKEWFEQEQYLPLANIVSICISFNLLEVKEDVNQGEKGKKWDVYYLNRWICLKFQLPLSFGGWRPKSVDELIKWIK